MTDPPQVSLELASPRDAPRIANLMELYLHDMSETFPIEVGDDGRFGYEKLPLYWSEPDRRFPFLIHADGRVAGFALVTKGSPVSDDPSVFDIAEFFVLRRVRRHGVGRQAAFALWNRLAGRWIVRVSEGNHRGMPFWTRTIAEYTQGALSESTRPGSVFPLRVFSFTSRAGG
jgi:predicted acetyltransferase